eukprot:COSAG01_NODE_63772_length_278_cov_8.424581_1_plen_67_part_01
MTAPPRSSIAAPSRPNTAARPSAEPTINSIQQRLARVCVNQRLFITNTGPPLGVYTCPHKVGYDVTL